MKNQIEQLLKEKANFRITNLTNGNDIWIEFVEVPKNFGKSFFRISNSIDNKPKFLQNPKNQIFDFVNNNTNLELDIFND